jgi:hypothetical protein
VADFLVENRLQEVEKESRKTREQAVAVIQAGKDAGVE